jgi:hypothetical protein
MDSIEIRMNRNLNPNMPVVMRGFVRSVGRDESVGQDGRPDRHVQVMGHDFGCAFVIQQTGIVLSLMQGQEVNPLSAALSAVNMIPQSMFCCDFIRNAVAYVKDIMTHAGQQFDFDLTVKEGYVEPQTVQNAEGPLWNLMTRYADLPWNELFVREGTNHPVVVYRETPWVDIDGTNVNPSPDVLQNIPFWNIDMSDIVALRAHRDDSDVANFIWVQNALVQQNQGTYWTLNKDGPGVATGTENDPQVFGYRLMQISSQQGPGGPSISLPEPQQQEAYDSLNEWLIKSIKWIVKATKNNADFESGTVQIKGNPNIRIGDYITVKRGPLAWSGYVTRVAHEFRMFQDYLTTINYIRSNQYFVRRRYQGNPWEAERKESDSLSELFGGVIG